ncbi:MAG: hypothetical protein AB7U79_07460 [Candidatus Izemoplasmatales bacterium]
MNLNINWSAYLSFDIHTGVASLEYSDLFFFKTNLERKKLTLTMHEILACIEPSDRAVAISVLKHQFEVSEPITVHVKFNEYLPIIELQTYILYLDNSIEILCMDESIPVQMMKDALLTEDMILTIHNYSDLEKRLNAAHKCEIISDLLYNIRDLMQ